MNTARSELIETARAVVTTLDLSGGNSAGSVGAAIRTVGGNVYTGVCIDLASGLGFCAEVAAIAQMVTNRETQIDKVVAVTGDGILPPCGRCRETMVQLDRRNLDCTVVLSGDEDVRLRDLLPNHWMDLEEDRRSG